MEKIDNEIRKHYKSLYKEGVHCETWEDYSKRHSDIVFELAKHYGMKCRVIREICCNIDPVCEKR